MHLFWRTYRLPVDLDGAVYAKLASLQSAAGKHGAEDGDVETPLKRREGHLHVRRHVADRLAEKGSSALVAVVQAGAGVSESLRRFTRLSREVLSALQLCGGEVFCRYRGRGVVGIVLATGTTTGGLFGSVIGSKVGRVKLDGRQETAGEHARPISLSDVSAVVASGNGFGHPFLLEESALVATRRSDLEAGQVIEVELVP